MKPMTTIINGIDELKSKVGAHLGYGDYLEITQERVNQFAEATGDHQWIHVDLDRAKAGRFGGPIAHGYLTLSLGPMLAEQVYRIEGLTMGIDYGTSKVRFPSPVPRPRWIDAASGRDAPRRRGRRRWRPSGVRVRLRGRRRSEAELRGTCDLPSPLLTARLCARALVL